MAFGHAGYSRTSPRIGSSAQRVGVANGARADGAVGWITVNSFTPQRGYRQVLRYRSATHYNDGNPLSVIDSEMPSLERRLGLWRPGLPLPLPHESTKACPKPHLKGAELWCE